MSMNLWECERPACKSTAVGCGGAAGLIAIGWYFRPGVPTLGRYVLLCPAHRPDPEPCREEGENEGKPCWFCAGEAESQIWQDRISDAHGFERLPRPRRRRAADKS